MKKLTRMKLINWHRFTDATLEFGASTLLSGENGAGKSTLLDAIQYVLTCTANNFNKAAHENGKRKLTGYIRCKTGREQQPYERTGEISAHIALEFYEESKNKYFILGVVIDSATEGQETVGRYLLDNCTLEDEMFCVGGRPRTITEFRTYNNWKLKQFVKTQAEAKKIVKQRLGRIDDKFFQLIPKALAFKPIDDIKDFVYSYVLDEKQVNIDVLRENVRSYQELEQTLSGVKKRIVKLEEIEKHYNLVTSCLKADRMYEFFLAKAQLDIRLNQLKTLEGVIAKEEQRLKELNAARNYKVEERRQKNELYTALLVEMEQNEEYRALKEQERNLEILQGQHAAQMDERKELLTSSHKALGQLVQLQTLTEGGPELTEYQNLLEHLKDTTDMVEAVELINKVIAYKNDTKIKLQGENLKLKLERENYNQLYIELNKKKENLERKRFSYPQQVDVLKKSIEQEMLRLGRTAEPRILCELLDIVDEKWRNAVEGYLNTQRFYVLVEPENFDLAIGIYDNLRKEKKAYGVGLINAAKLDAYDTVPQGTLAAMVESKNVYAKRYINMVLGKVQLCERVDELKQYHTAITPSCMRYQNHVASAIRPEIYAQPFIGQNAIRIQLEQVRTQLQDLHREMEELQNKIKEKEVLDKFLGTEFDVDIKYRIPVLAKLERTALTIKACKEEIGELKKHTTFIDKQVQVEKLKATCQELDNAIAACDREMGSSERAVSNARSELVSSESIRVQENKAVIELLAQAGDNAGIWQQEYAKQNSDKTTEQFLSNFDRRKKANWTQKETAEKQMTAAMVDYKTAFDFGAAASYEAYYEYAAVHERLVTSELLTYEEKVAKARLSAEEEFREQFLAKLQENIKMAQSEFKELNKALDGIVFSNETYQFLHMPSKKYRKFYDMIMDDFNAAQGESIFSGAFHENHKEVIDELFFKLALDQENSGKTLDEFTDYRTYMDYDIKIFHDDGYFSLYSKVCEEKSGGETQTPFYVTVAASFVQLYANNIGGEALGLVMFDEAFNNMDDERIGGVLEFLQRLPLQIIISAPPDKIQYIGPKMEETLLVFTDKKMSFVEEYRYAALH